MNHVVLRKTLALCIIMLFLGTSVLPSIGGNSKEQDVIKKANDSTVEKQQSLEKFVSLSLFFTENKGQFPEEVLFQAHVSGTTMYFCKDSIITVFSQPLNETLGNHTDTKALMPTQLLHKNNLSYHVISIVTRFVNANKDPLVSGQGLLSHRNNYFIGNNPEKWYTDVPNYQTIIYKDLYPGIDLRYYSEKGSLKYDFIVNPGANPSQIKMRYQGADALRYTSEGKIEITTKFGSIFEKAPVIYQDVQGVRQEISGRFNLYQHDLFGFEITDTYDRNQPLIIDPELAYSTYISGTNYDYGTGIAVDTNGYAYVTGSTYSIDFPTTPGAYDPSYNGGCDVFVTKLNPEGTSLAYSTYLGGTNSDYGEGIAVDASGNAYVTGPASSSDFPTTPGAYDTTHNGYYDVFVTKLSPSGNTLVYSTYIGYDDQSLDIAVDASGNAYVTGYTGSSDFPTTTGAYDTAYNGGYNDVFVTKLSSSGNTLVYSTYLGGMFDEIGRGIAVDTNGCAYVTGGTSSSDFPTTPGAYDTIYNDDDVFVTTLSPAGNTLVYSTYLGGTNEDYGRGIAVDASGNAYITGETYSSDFPTTPGAYDTTYSYYDIFVTKLTPTGIDLVYSTYLGGTSTDFSGGIAVDNQGYAYITGETGSTDFPTTPDAYDTSFNGNGDAFITKFSPSGNTLAYSTYLGGTDYDSGSGIAVDANECTYISGDTQSSDFPTTPGAYNSTYNGEYDVFVAKFSEGRGDHPDITLNKGENYVGNTGFASYYYYVADVVNAANGNMHITESDLVLPCLGSDLGIDITRNYNIHNALYKTMFGYGWTVSYNVYLIEKSDSSVILVGGDGSFYNFTSLGDGEYQSPLSKEIRLNKNPDGSFTLRYSNGNTYQFDSQGILMNISDKNGNHVYLTYASEKLVNITDDSGLWIAFQYNAQGFVQSVSDPLGRSVTYEYDIKGDLRNVTDPMGNTTLYFYSLDHHLVGRVDVIGRVATFHHVLLENGLTKTFAIGNSVYNYTLGSYPDPYIVYNITYDSNTVLHVQHRGQITELQLNAVGNPTSISRSDCGCGVILQEWDAGMNMITKTNERGYSWHYTYDEYRNLLSSIDPLSHTTTYNWDRIDTDDTLLCLIKTVTDFRGAVTSYDYDEHGNQIHMTDALGNTTSYTYDVQGLLTSIRDARGFYTNYTYNVHGTLGSEINAEGGVTYYTYDDGQRLVNITDSNGHTTHYEYDSLNRLTRVNDPLGHSEIYEYNAFGDIVNVTNENGNILHLKSNFINQVDTVVDPLGNETKYKYDRFGNIIESTDSTENKTKYYYDDLNRLVKTIDPSGNTEQFSYDEVGNLLSYTDKSGNTTTYMYDPLNRLISITRPDDNVSTIVYDDINNTVTEVDEEGRSTTTYYDVLDRFIKKIDAAGHIESQYTYDAVGNVVETKDARGNAETYEFNGLNLATTITDPSGNKTFYEFDTVGNLVKNTDPQGYVTTYKHDPLNRVVNETDALGSTTKYEYDALGNLIKATDARGFNTTYEYDSLNRLMKKTNPLGYSILYNYDSLSRIVETVDERGNSTFYKYDNVGQLVRVTDALGNSITYTYDPNGNQIQFTDKRGFTTKYSFDDLNRLIIVEKPDGNTIHYGYDRVGNKVSMTDERGYTTTYSYDNLDRLIRETDATGNTSRNTYDDTNNLISFTDANNNTRTYEYDKLNRQTTTTSPLGYTTRFVYDDRSNLVAVIDANGNTSRYTYDALNRRVNVTDPLGNTEYRSYDADSNLISLTDKNGNTVTYGYDALGQMRNITDQLGEITYYEYDAVGNKKQVTDANGHITHYEYDALNRHISTSYLDGSTIRYGYDAEGNLIQLKNTEGSGNSSFTYDDRNQLASVTVDYGSFSKTITYTYDGTGNRVTMTDPDGGLTTYGYDPVNRLVNITDPSNNGTTYKYDAAGNRIRMNYPNGVNTTYTYDDAERLINLRNTKSSGEVLSNYTYSYDKVGNKLQMTDADEAVTSYRYDARYQLINVTYPDRSNTHYTYDGVGNRLTQIVNGTETVYTYDNVNRLLSAGTTDYSYDNDGNLIGKTNTSGTTTYQYDYENRLTKVTLPDASQVTYHYSPLGNRLSKTTAAGTTYYVYDREDVLMELDEAGVPKARYTHGPGIDEPISMKREGVVSYYHFDGLGSVTSLTNSAEDIVATYTYDVFGNIKGETGVIKNPYRFTGREYDKETDLYYYRARSYDSVTGRFLQRDPISLVNLYVYVRNNPIRYSDPFGLEDCEGAHTPIEQVGTADIFPNVELEEIILEAGDEAPADSVIEFSTLSQGGKTAPSPTTKGAGAAAALEMLRQVVQLVKIYKFNTYDARDNARKDATKKAAKTCQDFCDTKKCDDPDYWCEGILSAGDFSEKRPELIRPGGYIAPDTKENPYKIKVSGKFQCSCKCSKRWWVSIWLGNAYQFYFGPTLTLQPPPPPKQDIHEIPQGWLPTYTTGTAPAKVSPTYPTNIPSVRSEESGPKLWRWGEAPPQPQPNPKVQPTKTTPTGKNNQGQCPGCAPARPPQPNPNPRQKPRSTPSTGGPDAGIAPAQPNPNPNPDVDKNEKIYFLPSIDLYLGPPSNIKTGDKRHTGINIKTLTVKNQGDYSRTLCVYDTLELWGQPVVNLDYFNGFEESWVPCNTGYYAPPGWFVFSGPGSAGVTWTQNNWSPWGEIAEIYPLDPTFYYNEWLVTRVFDFSYITQISLSFDYNAQLGQGGVFNSDLYIYASTNGGTDLESFGLMPIYTIYPTVSEDWTPTPVNIDLSFLSGEATVYLAFVFSGHEENCIAFHLDNVHIQGSGVGGSYKWNLVAAGISAPITLIPYTKVVTYFTEFFGTEGTYRATFAPGTLLRQNWSDDDPENDVYQVVFTVINDTTPPNITSIQAIPAVQESGGHINITCTAEDNLQVETVCVRVTYPDASTTNETMTRIQNMDTYFYNTTYTILGTYSYSIWAQDTSGHAFQSDSYTFLIDNPPYQPSNPNPPNGIISISINADLSWTGGDPDPGDTVLYDVYFGNTISPQKKVANQSTTVYDPGPLNYNISYYWQIIAWDNHGVSIVGPLWSFTTLQPGSVFAWGNNEHGQCVVPGTNTGFVEVAAGRYHSLGLKNNGSIVGWGWNTYGQCTVPLPNTSFIAVAAGGFHSLGLKANGSIVAWGWNSYGQCTVPLPNTDFIEVAAGGAHSLGLKDDGSIVAWGSNSNGQCVVPLPNTGFVAVSAGMYHSLGLKANGSIAAWGSNTYGQCTVPPPNTGFVAVSAGMYHSLGLKANGSIVAWGYNSSGQCDVPVPNTGFIAVAAGGAHSLGLKDDGSIIAWGWNVYGQCNVTLPNTGFVAVAAGVFHSLAIKLNQPPYAPSAPSPVNGTINIPINTILSWTGGDPDSDPVTYDVYFGTASQPPKMSTNQSSTTYDPGTMQYNTIYYWRIIAWDNHGASAIGPLWHFTTEPQPVQPPNTPIHVADGCHTHDHPNDMNKGIGKLPCYIQPPQGVVQTFSTTSTNTGSIYYKFFFGDGTNSSWLGPYTSGQVATATHDYNNIGIFQVTVIAKVGTVESIPSTPLSVRMYKCGDINGDNLVDFGDINPFVSILTNSKAVWYNQFPNGYWWTGDINNDCSIDFGDINPFVQELTSCPP